MEQVTPIWKREPAVIAATIQAALGVAVAFGLNLSTEQMGALMALVSLILGVTVRSMVTPTTKDF